METQTVTLTKREAAMKMSLDMIREWCCSNLKGKKAVKIAISVERRDMSSLPIIPVLY